MKEYLLYIVLSSILLLSCSSREQKIRLDVPPINYKKELLDYFKSNYAHIEMKNEAKLDSLEWLDKLYASTNFKPLWIGDSIVLTKAGIELIEQLSSARDYGLNTAYYPLNSLLKLKNDLLNIPDKRDRYAIASNLELQLSYYFMLHGQHLNHGVFDAIDSVTILPKKRFDIDLPIYLKKASTSDSIINKLLDLQPNHSEYQNLQKGLRQFMKNSSLSTESIRVTNFREDSTSAIQQAKKALVLHRYLQEERADSLYGFAIQKFQQEHGLKPDGIIGENTAKALSMSPYEYYQQIIANIERWKWKANWSKNYLYVNTAAYKLELYENAKLTKEHKVVVGKLKNQTPEIVDSLKYIIAYPYWNVPRKISLEEILAKVQKDSTYLDRNNFEVLNYAKEALDASSIDWKQVKESNFNYLIRQKGGRSNSLGLVKFIFPNKHAIYLHDTPTKYHFGFETRARSHGCVRVHKALNLAEHLLKSDRNKYTIDSISSYIKMEKEKYIVLNKKIPIHIYYFSVTADKSGRLTFYNDVYGLDKKLINELIKCSD